MVTGRNGAALWQQVEQAARSPPTASRLDRTFPSSPPKTSVSFRPMWSQRRMSSFDHYCPEADRPGSSQSSGSWTAKLEPAGPLFAS